MENSIISMFSLPIIFLSIASFIIGGGSVFLLRARKIITLEKTVALTQDKLTMKEADYNKLSQQFDVICADYNNEKERRIIAEQQVKASDAKIEDWEKTRADFMQSARAAALHSATELSNKLITDHKRENAESLKNSEKQVENTTRQAILHFEKITASISNFEGRLHQQEATVTLLNKALTEPQGIGSASETILENTLKAFGLEVGRDFVTQHSFSHDDGRMRRPDAVLFLPDDNILIVDSKASVALSSLAEFEGEDGNLKDEEQQLKRLKDAMNKHLNELASKEYKSTIEKGIKLKNRHIKPKNILTLLWLPSDGAVERVRRADADITQKAAEKNIFIAGPSGLWSAIGIAGLKISSHRQIENQGEIVKETESLLQHIARILTLAEKLGRGLRSAEKAFDDMAVSVNKRLLPKARQIIKLGASAPSGGINAPLKLLGGDDILADTVVDGARENLLDSDIKNS